jgi:hypothetical protein
MGLGKIVLRVANEKFSIKQIQKNAKPFYKNK